MGIKVLYQKGVFKPLEKVKGIREGEELEIHLEIQDWNRLAMSNPSLDFLKTEPDVYTERDIIKAK